MGVIEPVPSGLSTKWQARMTAVAKSDGSPSRALDFRNLNKHYQRETHHVVLSYKQVRLIPAGRFRTVTDCRNVYHSCLAHTQHNCRYCVALHGFLASGDGYNQCYDSIIADVARKTKWVDDVAMWDDDFSLGGALVAYD